MQLAKGYRLLKFMNRPHGFLIRGCFSVGAWAGALCTTRSFTLAKKLAAEYWQDSFYSALRKSARFARYFSARLDFFNDPFYDFTSGADGEELDALQKHLQTLKNVIPLNVYLTDLLYIQAARIHGLLLCKQDASVEISIFYELANRVLRNIKIKDEQNTFVSSLTEGADDFDITDARQALEDIAKLLPNRDWPWYVVSGTFLGLHREGGFLSHDYDIDLGINAEDIEIDALLSKLRKSHDFTIGKLDYHYEVLGNGSQRTLRTRLSIIKLVHKNGLQIDLFIHYTENGRCWHGSSIHRWENTPFKLVEREFEGVMVLAPENADRYLTENYGDWRTPVKEFDCTTGTPNLVVAKNFISVALFIKRYSYFAIHDPQAAIKLLHTMQVARVFSVENTNNEINLIFSL